jgi:lipoprotein-releasing system permease protein
VSAGAVWDALAGLGGTVALTFIVALAAGLAVLTLFFLGSAVVVLERFARAARGALPAAGLALGCAGLLAAVSLEEVRPEVAILAWDATLRAWGELFGSVVLHAVAWVAVARGLLAALRSRALFLAVLLGLGVAYAAVAAGLGHGFSFAGVPRLAEPVLLGLVPLGAAGFLGLRGSAEWFIAARYLVAKRRQTFISIITLICVGGVAAGVWLIITVLSVMNGFERVWREEIIGNRAHFTVQSGLGPFEGWRDVLDRVSHTPGVVGASPFLDAEGMVRGAGGEIVGVKVRGVDPARVGDVTDLRQDMVAGSLAELGAEPDGQDPGIIVGSHLAAALGLEVGDALLVISPFGGPPTPLGPGPRLSRFRVAGIFQSSFFQYDEIFTFVSLSAAQSFRRVDDVVEGIEVRAEDLYRSARVATSVEQALGFPFFTRDWKEVFPAFFQALKTERAMMFVLLTMIMVVAAFVIVATLVMMIMEKSSDIAILKAMGASDAAVERIFAIEGTLIGLVGTLLGIVAGVAVTTRLDFIQDQVEAVTGIDTLPASVYQFSHFPFEFDLLQIAGVAAIAMVLSLGATWLPSRQGSRLDPAEALRYE